MKGQVRLYSLALAIVMAAARLAAQSPTWVPVLGPDDFVVDGSASQTGGVRLGLPPQPAAGSRVVVIGGKARRVEADQTPRGSTDKAIRIEADDLGRLFSTWAILRALRGSACEGAAVGLASPTGAVTITGEPFSHAQPAPNSKSPEAARESIRGDKNPRDEGACPEPAPRIPASVDPGFGITLSPRPPQYNQQLIIKDQKDEKKDQKDEKEK
jgi:hypothetical protein